LKERYEENNVGGMLKKTVETKCKKKRPAGKARGDTWLDFLRGLMPNSGGKKG